MSFLRDYLLDCPFKKNFGIECFGCGFQRSVVLLFEGQFLESIKMYPATIPIFILWLFVILHLVFKFEKGAKVILFLFITSTTIIVTNYLLKLFYV